ncbi:hypothetical protein QBC43DRAFT_310925 [Cladorrhinum sp. PSN259]|nr:hypothetical protein QBC43DRAFT_310925 [Cladorrhinum sp. PSN259]
MAAKSTTTGTTTESAAPWTATRCHRLLRPLLTHIAALRKEKERRPLIRNGQGAITAFQQSQLTNTRPRKSVVLGKRPRGYPESDDDYGSGKKPVRKYGRRGRPKASSSENPPTTPGRNGHQHQRRQQASRPSQENEVVLPTPFLRRVRNHLPSSPAVPVDEPTEQEFEPPQIGITRCHHSTCLKTRCCFDMEFRDLRRTNINAEQHSLFESVFKAMDALLKATSPSKNQAAGPKSLLAMCLRKVPEYIEWEKKETAEEDETKTAPQDCGLSFEIYSELETLGIVNGWKHLCIVTRAHGVKIIQDAAAEGLLEDSNMDMLIRLCLEYMPVPEFAGLITTYVTRQYSRTRSSFHTENMFTCVRLRPLRILRACDPSGTSLLPRLLSTLFVEELLPSDWILTPAFSEFWPSVISHIASVNKPCQDNLTFMIEIITLLCNHAAPRKPRGVPQSQIRGKAQTTLVSAIGALGSIVLLSEEGGSKSASSSTTRTAVIKRRVEYAISTISSNLKRQQSKGRKLGRYLLALCSFLSLSDSTSSTVLESAWKGVTTCKGNPTLMLQYDATTSLMSSIAHFCGRGSGLPPNIYLRQMCDKLEYLKLPGGLRDMRVDGAFRLAEATGDLRDLDDAEMLRLEMMRPPGRGDNNGGEKEGRAGFGGMKWDEGIGEWVLGTPGSVVSKSAVLESRRISLRGSAVDEGQNGVARKSSLRVRAAEAVDSGEDDEEDWEYDIDDNDEDDEDDEDEWMKGGVRRIMRGNRIAMATYRSEGEDEEEVEEDEEEDDSMEADSYPNTSPESAAEDAREASPNTEASSQEDAAPELDESSADEISFDTPKDDNNNNMPNRRRPSSLKKPVPRHPFLAARPRRLSKPITITKGGDELALDTMTITSQDHQGKNWLSRKKPLRFTTASTRALRVGVGSAPVVPVAKKKVQRASLMAVEEDDSDDELSFI